MSRTALLSAIGNAMSVNVLERILPRIAWSIGKLPQKMHVWDDESWALRGGRFNDESSWFL
eukprot:2640347-Pyramimonas_sp.AAC.1